MHTTHGATPFTRGCFLMCRKCGEKYLLNCC
nr:MAG TPA: MqsA [Caudoviricetes sp.]